MHGAGESFIPTLIEDQKKESGRCLVTHVCSSKFPKEFGRTETKDSSTRREHTALKGRC